MKSPEMIVFSGLLFTCYLLLILLQLAVGQDAELTVETTCGKVLGKRLLVSDKNVDAFLGIPYAKPPTGSQRFKKPEACDRWSGTYNATTFGYGCHLFPDTVFGDFVGSVMWNPNVKLSEDCLVLNVWTPSAARSSNAKLTVMVWIFGGGFTSGVSSLDVYDGAMLAAQHNVVVVSMNYRLGSLGFLALDPEEAPGNMGLWDQYLALQWVENNIPTFGGEPLDVTIFGESAGSVSVSLHLLSPKSQYYFKRAIMQSGSPTAPWATITKEEAEKRGKSLAIKLNCTINTEGKALTNSEIVDCLRTRDPQDFIVNDYVVYGVYIFPFVPIVDGDFLTETPETSLQRRSFKNSEVLMGTNVNEGFFFVIYYVPGFLEDVLASEALLDQEAYELALQQTFAINGVPFFSQLGLDSIKFQYTDWTDPDNQAKHRDAIDAMSGDYSIICPCIEFADYWSDAGRDVYYYHFSQRSAYHPWPEWMGVLHGDEIAYVFGQPLYSTDDDFFNEDDEALSTRMMEYWVNFAKTGSPTTDDQNGWPKYNSDGREYLELNSSYLDTPKIGRALRAQPCAYWNKYFLEFVTSTDNINDAEAQWKVEFEKWSNVYMVDWKAEFDNYVTNKETCNSDNP